MTHAFQSSVSAPPLDVVTGGARSDVTPELLAASPAVMVGTVGQIVDKLERERDELGIDWVQLDAGFAPKDIPSLAPVVTALVGR